MTKKQECEHGVSFGDCGDCLAVFEYDAFRRDKQEGIRIGLEKAIKIISKYKNPYPEDIFIGKTEEGKYGVFGRKVVNNTKADIIKELKSVLSKGEKVNDQMHT